jgi:CDGSH-type Zn-finger protein/truncated hemoglobin YjbI
MSPIDGTADVSPSADQGPLAQVIATRGGKASPEAPLVIEHREALIYMLCQAAELEHGIMCQYLFAAFSLKQRADEGLSDDELEAVSRWRTLILHVATQEMLHLALVHNLLSAIGAAPHLARPNLPHPAQHYPAGVQLALLPFGEEALQHFMFLERPEGMDLEDADGLVAVGRAEPHMAEADIVPRTQDFATIGHLYRSIEHGIAHLAEKFGEEWLFVGPPRAQATAATFRWPELVSVTDVDSAQRAIDTILEQGEGPRGHWRAAHFGDFVGILDEYQQMRQANPQFDAVRPVLAANVRPNERGVDVPLITDTVTARCVDLFNVGYEVLLQMLERYFAHTEETDAQLATLADVTLALMFQVLEPLGELVTSRPVGPGFEGRTAGPSFELFYESDYLMPHREAAWALLAERLDEAAAFCARIRSKWADEVGEELAPIGSALVEMVQNLQAHFPDWGARPRTNLSTVPPVAARPDAADLQALRGRTEELARHAGSPGAAKPEQLTSLFDRTRRLALSLLAPPEHDAAPDGGTARRLIESVLRPLADALHASGSADIGHHPVEAKQIDNAEDPLWAITMTATSLRAALGTASPPQLTEAIAALQDLAAQLPEPEDAAGRLAELRRLQTSLDSRIEPAPDGPYLVTNPPTLRDWLGSAMATRPQMALCRCGGSGIKPLCDGTHAAIDFRSAKDPKRVTDRRNTYDGVEVTILDNRGTCQHSGLCSDRLAAVFRVDQEPFVAPSGGRMDEIIRAVRDCPSGALSYAIDGHEQRRHVDWDDQRDPNIEVTKDGPYRITGGIRLAEVGDRRLTRNHGASHEHYALCRCGHSQNKPFCSGMHWYVDFRDPVPDPDHEPTLFEWCGGLPALTRMTRLFYERYVPEDPLLAPIFADMTPDHPHQVAGWLGEVCGGPKTDPREPGRSTQIDQYLNNQVTDQQRARWVTFLLQSADDAGLPRDPQFRSAFTALVEWGSRIAVQNAQPGTEPPEHTAVPKWNWGAAGPPTSRIAAPEATEQPDDQTVVVPGPDETVGFDRHIKGLFRAKDRQSMKFAFDLWSYDDVSQHADDILTRLQQGSMPCDGKWNDDWVTTFRRWVDSGKDP